MILLSSKQCLSAWECGKHTHFVSVGGGKEVSVCHGHIVTSWEQTPRPADETQGGSWGHRRSFHALHVCRLHCLPVRFTTSCLSPASGDVNPRRPGFLLLGFRDKTPENGFLFMYLVWEPSILVGDPEATVRLPGPDETAKAAEC